MIKNTLFIALIVPTVVYVLKKARDARNMGSAIGKIPGRSTVTMPFSSWGNIFQNTENWLIYGMMKALEQKRAIYAKGGWDIYAVTSILPAMNTIFISDAAAIKQITSDRIQFPKPLTIYEALNLFGWNIIYSEGDIWKRYRKLSSPAFSDRNNKIVWDEAMAIMDELVEDSKNWDDGRWDSPNFLEYTLEIAIRIISVAGFGERSSIAKSLQKGHTMTFQDCLKIMSRDLAYLFITPDWLPNITSGITEARTAKNEFGSYLNEMIENRKGKQQERYDLFSTLLDAHEEEVGDNQLSKDELLGNMFMFIVAGHETTAHMLCYAFSLLALYPEVQERLHKHCMEVYPTDHEPSYSEMSLFTFSHAVLNETLRLHPIVPSIPKTVIGDVVLTIGNENNDETESFAVPKDSLIILHTAGLHYNPRYWKNPEQFIPERFLDPEWPRDAFIPFSTGARSCLGRKFTETEAVVILTRMIMNYQVTILEEPQYKNETFEERKKRVMESHQGLSLTPQRTPLSFKRRI